MNQVKTINEFINHTWRAPATALALALFVFLCTSAMKASTSLMKDSEENFTLCRTTISFNAGIVRVVY